MKADSKYNEQMADFYFAEGTKSLAAAKKLQEFTVDLSQSGRNMSSIAAGNANSHGKGTDESGISVGASQITGGRAKLGEGKNGRGEVAIFTSTSEGNAIAGNPGSKAGVGSKESVSQMLRKKFGAKGAGRASDKDNSGAGVDDKDLPYFGNYANTEMPICPFS